MSMDIVILGLSITSSWGNGHATTFRALVRELAAQGHRVTFLERDVPWYAENRDMPEPPWCRTVLYRTLDELKDRHAPAVADADAVIVGSFVPDGVAVGEWVQATARGLRAFYDIDTPVTLGKLARGDEEYLSADIVPGYDLYLSFTGGPTLDRLEQEFGSPMARALFCSVDPSLYHPEPVAVRWDLGYLGTYSDDRQPTVETLLCAPARVLADRSFVVAGPQYPAHVVWPDNVERIQHLPPPEHRRFYCAQRFTLNVTRADMIAAGWSPSVRLFEAAACGTPIISDWWEGLDRLFEPGEEIIIAHGSEDAVAALNELSEERRKSIGAAARRKVLGAHTSAHRARQLVDYLKEAAERRARRPRTPVEKGAVTEGIAR